MVGEGSGASGDGLEGRDCGAFEEVEEVQCGWSGRWEGLVVFGEPGKVGLDHGEPYKTGEAVWMF